MENKKERKFCENPIIKSIFTGDIASMVYKYDTTMIQLIDRMQDVVMNKNDIIIL